MKHDRIQLKGFLLDETAQVFAHFFEDFRSGEVLIVILTTICFLVHFIWEVISITTLHFFFPSPYNHPKTQDIHKWPRIHRTGNYGRSIVLTDFNNGEIVATGAQKRPEAVLPHFEAPQTSLASQDEIHWRYLREAGVQASSREPTAPVLRPVLLKMAGIRGIAQQKGTQAGCQEHDGQGRAAPHKGPKRSSQDLERRNRH